MEDWNRPPRLSSSSLTWVAVATTSSLILLSASLGEAISSGVTTGSWQVLGFRRTLRAATLLARSPKQPARDWGGNAAFGTAMYWLITGSIAAVLAAIGITLVRRLTHRRSRRGRNGFATTAEVRKVASLRAARRKASETRPALIGQGGYGGRELAQAEVGYALGIGRRPRGARLVAHWETSMRLVAPPGEGKTTRVMQPVGGSHPGPLFATSTKSDLYLALRERRATLGKVWVLDPEGLAPDGQPVRWSPVIGCVATRTAERRAAALVAAGADTSDVRSGEFFRSSAKTLLAALLHAAALGNRTMADVVKWAGDPGDPTPAQILAEFDEGPSDWSSRVARHTRGSEATTSGVMRTLDLALGCFQHDDVLALTSPDPTEAFDFTRFLDNNETVFALGKDRPGGVSPLITAFAEELIFAAEVHAANKPYQRLDPPLLFLLDEVPSIAPLPSLPVLAADGRSRGLVLVYAMQSFSQAVQRWGREGAETLANATTVTCVFGGLKVADDLRELSRLCGSTKVLHQSSSEDVAGPRQSVSATWAEEPVLAESQIRMLPDGVALLLWAKLPPILAYLPGSWEHGSRLRARVVTSPAPAR